MRVTVYEVGPRDGLQALSHVVPVEQRRELIHRLYMAGLDNIEEVSFPNPKVLPQMADGEEVFSGRGSALVMNARGMQRAKACGVEKINVVFSPCEAFNIKNMRATRDEIVLRYRIFMQGVPKENVRVYLSMAFGSPESGLVSENTMRSCLRDAKMFGNTVVFADTVGGGAPHELPWMVEMAHDEGLKVALHLHHRDNEARALMLVRKALLEGVTEFDSSIGGLGGCPFAKGSGANLSTETLVNHLHAWGFKTGIDTGLLNSASDFAYKLQNLESEICATHC